MKGTTMYRIALVSILGTAVVGSTLAIATTDRRTTMFDPLIEIEHLLATDYVTEPDYDALQLGAIEGMIESLDDPYTIYVPPSERQGFDKELTGEYVGIGALIRVVDGWLTVVSPLDGSPAYFAGVMADDRVVEIEGESTYGKSGDECVELLTGEPGTDVSVVIERGSERLDLTITREHIKTQTVKGFHRDAAADESPWEFVIDPERSIAYARLTQFTPACSDELARVLGGLGAREGRLGGFVLDLRENPGGTLEDAVRIADLFLSEGVIVSTKGRAFPEEKREASAEGTLPDFPMAVLINERSASASEILSGALVDHDRAVAVGTRTFGKGSVQTVRTFGRAEVAELKMTTQRYYLPSGRSIQRLPGETTWGVDPSPGFYVPMSDEELIEAITVRREQDVIRPGESAESEDWTDTGWVLDRLADPQLDAAVRAVQKRIDTGGWIPTGLEGIGGDELALGELRDLKLRRERVLRELARIDRRENELETMAAEGDDSPTIDLWDDAARVEGGEVVVYGADGAEVARLRITGPDLERWLIDAGVERE